MSVPLTPGTADDDRTESEQVARSGRVDGGDEEPAMAQVRRELASIRATEDPAERLRAARVLEAELLGWVGEVRTVIAEAAARGHAAHPETLDARQQAPWS